MAVIALSFLSLVPLYIFLSFRVIRQRRASQVAYGVGESKELVKRVGAHSNFSQYVPIVLLGMLIAHSLGAADSRLLIAAILIVIGRYLHAFGLLQTRENFRYRVTGMLLTFASLISLALTILFEIIRQNF